MKVSKALQDVWRWKDEVYQETKDLSGEELVAYFRAARERFERESGVRLRVVPSPARRKPR